MNASEIILVSLFHSYPHIKWQLAGMLPREWKKCTLSAELILNPMTGVIIHCEAL